MAVNKVVYGNQTIMDISDTTAEPCDVVRGKTFHTANGELEDGILGAATTTTDGLMSAADKALLDASTDTFYWTPKIYDYNTYLFDAPQQEYFKLGKLKIFSVRFNVPQAYNIATMLQIRNLPCNVILGGNCYIGTADTKVCVMQGRAASDVWPRPNFKGDLPANTSITAIIIGY